MFFWRECTQSRYFIWTIFHLKEFCKVEKPIKKLIICLFHFQSDISLFNILMKIVCFYYPSALSEPLINWLNEGTRSCYLWFRKNNSNLNSYKNSNSTMYPDIAQNNDSALSCTPPSGRNPQKLKSWCGFNRCVLVINKGQQSCNTVF